MHYRIALATQKTSAFRMTERAQHHWERGIDLPAWVESEGDARAAEDSADGMRRLYFEFVFLPSWWVPDRDQQFVASGSLSKGSSRGRGNLLQSEGGLGFRLYVGICSRSVLVKSPTQLWNMDC
jgi:hypothetical protein